MNRLILPVIAAVALVGCTSTSPQSQMATILALESGLTAADEVALAYFALPPCSAASGAICSAPDIKAKIKVAAQTAHDTIKAAEKQAAAGASVDLTASNAAMTALQAILTSLPKS